MAFLKRIKISIYIVIGLLVLVLVINKIVSSVIENKLTEFLTENASEYYKASIGKASFKLLNRSVVFNDIELKTKALATDSLEESKPNFQHIKLSSIMFKGIGVFSVLLQNEVVINTLEINDLLVVHTNNKKKNEPASAKKSFALDSIVIKKIDGIEVDNIVVNNFIFNQIDRDSKDVVFENEPIDFNIGGFKLEKQQPHIFELLPVDESIEVFDIKLKMNKSRYNFSTKKLQIDFEEHIVTLNNVNLVPQIPKEELARTYTYTKDIFNLDLEELKVYNFNLSSLLAQKGIYSDSLLISGVKLELYKDKRKPFDIHDYKTLPHIALHNSKIPIHVSKLGIKNSTILIQEQVKHADTLMSVFFEDVLLNVENINSDTTESQEPMLLDLSASLMGNAPFNFYAKFPINRNTFYFNGHLYRAKLDLFDSALFPAVGLKVFSGDLSDLKFSGIGNNVSSKGEMTMLYENLEARVFKEHSFETNKFLSWGINALVKKSNPVRNNKPRVAVMHFERDTYKGLGNYLWKSIFSGIANTLLPIGNTVKDKK